MTTQVNSNIETEKQAPTIALVVPCYNEEEIIQTTVKTLTDYFNRLKESALICQSSFLCFVDDGSKDSTLELLKSFQCNDDRISIIKLSKNFGHQSALLAGLNFCSDKCDCTITLDADLQDDINAIEKMVVAFNSGSEIVYGVRDNRDSDTFFKKWTAQIFYKFMHMLGTSTLNNHADFRLLSRRATELLLKYKEANFFLRGIVTQIGLKSEIVYYKRKKREAGETKYPVKKMIAFAIEGITSFSEKPLRIVTMLGLSIIILSILVGGYIIFSISSESTVRGWASLIVSIWFLGGIQVFCIGIIGEYIGKIYKETKNRPKFFIEEISSK